MGLATARCLAEDGARVAVVGRSADVLVRRRRGTRATAVAPRPSASWRTPGDAARVDELFIEIGERLERPAQRSDQHRRARRRRHVRSAHRRTMAGGGRRRRDGHGALRARCTAIAAPRGLGAHRQLLCAFDAAAERHAARVHRGQGDGEQRVEESVALLAKDEILVNVVSPGSIATEALVGWAATVGVDGTRSLRADGSDRRTLRSSGAPAPRRAPQRDRARRGFPCLTAQFVHDRS